MKKIKEWSELWNTFTPKVWLKNEAFKTDRHCIEWLLLAVQQTLSKGRELASYHATNGFLTALENFFKARLPEHLRQGPVNARVQLLGSADIDGTLSGNVLGIYMRRMVIDPHGRGRVFPVQGVGQRGLPDPELPVNLHLLLIASASSATIEADLMSWAMVALANESQFDISHMAEFDQTWTEREVVTVTPEDLPTEDYLRIWDVLDTNYTTSVPYVARTLRLRLKAPESMGPDVVSRVFPTGVAE
jgi:hypothetical protein